MTSLRKESSIKEITRALLVHWRWLCRCYSCMKRLQEIMQTFLVLQKKEVEQFFSSYLLDILHGVLFKKKRCVVMPNSVCIRSRGEIFFFLILMISMEISPGCQMGMNFKTIRTACSAYSYPNSLHLSFFLCISTYLPSQTFGQRKYLSCILGWRNISHIWDNFFQLAVQFSLEKRPPFKNWS